MIISCLVFLSITTMSILCVDPSSAIQPTSSYTSNFSIFPFVMILQKVLWESICKSCPNWQFPKTQDSVSVGFFSILVGHQHCTPSWHIPGIALTAIVLATLHTILASTRDYCTATVLLHHISESPLYLLWLGTSLNRLTPAAFNLISSHFLNPSLLIHLKLYMVSILLQEKIHLVYSGTFWFHFSKFFNVVITGSCCFFREKKKRFILWIRISYENWNMTPQTFLYTSIYECIRDIFRIF